MKLKMKKIVEVDAKVLNIYTKVCDNFCCSIKDQDGEIIKDYEGYVPSFMPDTGGGDYISLKIDMDTGTILNWKQVCATDVEDFLKGEDE